MNAFLDNLKPASVVETTALAIQLRKIPLLAELSDEDRKSVV